MSTRPELVIVGAGGFGREAYDLAATVNGPTQTRWSAIGFVTETTADEDRTQAPVRYGLDTVADGAHYLIAIGNGRARRRLAGLLDQRLVAATVVHPSVVIGSRVRIGTGSIVCSHTSITTNVELGRHVIVNLNCTIGHDCVFGDYVTLSPGSVVSGGVRLGEGVELGSGAVVLPGVAVGAWSTVGAGAVVVRDVPDGVTVVGVPAKPLPVRTG